MGEFELLELIRQRLPPPGPQVRVGSGDDAAITVPGGATATSVDALVEGVHFKREWSSLRQIGHKALAVALSDLAAMGAEPGEAYVVLGVPADLDEEGWDTEDDVGLTGLGAHCRQIGKSNGQGLVADLPEAAPLALEVDTLHQRVDRGRSGAAWHGYRGVIAAAHAHLRTRRRQPLSDQLEQLELAHAAILAAAGSG